MGSVLDNLLNETIINLEQNARMGSKSDPWGRLAAGILDKLEGEVTDEERSFAKKIFFKHRTLGNIENDYLYIIRTHLDVAVLANDALQAENIANNWLYMLPARVKEVGTPIRSVHPGDVIQVEKDK